MCARVTSRRRQCRGAVGCERKVHNVWRAWRAARRAVRSAREPEVRYVLRARVWRECAECRERACERVACCKRAVRCERWVS